MIQPSHSRMNINLMLETLRDCAENGTIPPSYAEITERFDFQTIEQAKSLIADLSDGGAIRIKPAGEDRFTFELRGAGLMRERTVSRSRGVYLDEDDVLAVRRAIMSQTLQSLKEKRPVSRETVAVPRQPVNAPIPRAPVPTRPLSAPKPAEMPINAPIPDVPIFWPTPVEQAALPPKPSRKKTGPWLAEIDNVAFGNECRAWARNRFLTQADFGTRAGGGKSVIERLRSGLGIQERTYQRILAFMADWDTPTKEQVAPTITIPDSNVVEKIITPGPEPVRSKYSQKNQNRANVDPVAFAKECLAWIDARGIGKHVFAADAGLSKNFFSKLFHGQRMTCDTHAKAVSYMRLYDIATAMDMVQLDDPFLITEPSNVSDFEGVAEPDSLPPRDMLAEVIAAAGRALVSFGSELIRIGSDHK